MYHGLLARCHSATPRKRNPTPRCATRTLVQPATKEWTSSIQLLHRGTVQETHGATTTERAGGGALPQQYKWPHPGGRSDRDLLALAPRQAAHHGCGVCVVGCSRSLSKRLAPDCDSDCISFLSSVIPALLGSHCGEPSSYKAVSRMAALPSPWAY